jgi:site-specific DNA-cytosine methylase
MKVLIACEFSGTVRDAFSKKGHEAWSCDLLDTETIGKHIKGDVLEILNQKWDLMIAHPPCQRLTCAANKYYKEEYSKRFPNIQKEREEAILFFMNFANAKIDKICIENPIGIMSTRYKKPNQIIQPYQFGHTERKSTCLWLKNLPQLKPTNIVKPDIIIHKNGKTDSRLHYETLKLPKELRSKIRSKTFQGIADAMANQWS